MKILLIDDDRLIRHILKEMLSKVDCELIFCENGEEGIKQFEESKPDLIILDVEMPKMNGYEAAIKIRELEKSSESKLHKWTPIIFLSSNLEDKYMEEGIKAGGDDYLKKPISRTVLLAKLKAMSRISNMQKALHKKSLELETANQKISKINSELEESNKKNEYYATHDTLTKLPNRLLLHDRIESKIAASKRYNNKFSLLFLDLDDFKMANDTLGHEAGDEILKTVSERIKNIIRESDTLGRLGGDEFVVILDDTKEQSSIEKVANSIIQAASNSIETTKGDAKIGVSIGASSYPEHGEQINELLNHADTAMYYAKEKGKNCFKIYDTSLEDHVAANNNLSEKLTQGLNNENPDS